MTTATAGPLRRTSAWPAVVGGLSVVYALLAILHGAAQFAGAAFGPIIPGVGGDRPPIAPLELRWHAALEAIFCFALGVMLLCAASLLLRRRFQGALMLGLWAASSIAVHIIFVAWSLTLEPQRERYQATAEEWRQQASEYGLSDAQPFARYEVVMKWTKRATSSAMTIPFIYPACVGLVLLTPSVRREIRDWN